MTYSESKFREYLKSLLGEPIWIKKLPDKKVTGSGAGTGLPDYICVFQGKTMWFEVKQSPTKTTFNLNLISESQYIEFDKMHQAGALIYLAIYVNKELYIVPYLSIRFAKFSNNDVSVNIDTLKSWRVKW